MKRNILRCPLCGFEIATKVYSRMCAKDGTLMEFIKTEEKPNRREE